MNALTSSPRAAFSDIVMRIGSRLPHFSSLPRSKGNLPIPGATAYPSLSQPDWKERGCPCCLCHQTKTTGRLAVPGITYILFLPFLAATKQFPQWRDGALHAGDFRQHLSLPLLSVHPLWEPSSPRPVPSGPHAFFSHPGSVCMWVCLHPVLLSPLPSLSLCQPLCSHLWSCCCCSRMPTCPPLFAQRCLPTTLPSPPFSPLFFPTFLP